MIRALPLLLLFVCAPLMAAETTGYRIVHPDGTVEFTDDAARGGEEIKLRDVPTVGTPKDVGGGKGDRRREEKPREEERSFNAYHSLSITSPNPEQTIWSNGEAVSVSVSIDPPLLSGHKIVVSLDGSEQVRGSSTSLAIAEVYRGTHSVSAAVVDQQGKILISSPPVTFYLHRHKINPAPATPPVSPPTL